MEPQGFLVLHIQLSKWHLIADIYNQEVGSFYQRMSKRHSHNSLPSSNNVFNLHISNQVLVSILAYTYGQALYMNKTGHSML
jgi:hypothetical protein